VPLVVPSFYQPLNLVNSSLHRLHLPVQNRDLVWDLLDRVHQLSMAMAHFIVELILRILQFPEQAVHLVPYLLQSIMYICELLFLRFD
jgi:hypothetical protein